MQKLESGKGLVIAPIVKIAAVAFAYRSHVAAPTPVVSVIRLPPSSVVDFLVKLAADPLGCGDELRLLDNFVHTKCPLNIGADLQGGVPVDAVRGSRGQMIQQVVDPPKAVICSRRPCCWSPERKSVRPR